MPKPFKPTRPFPIPPGADILEHEGRPHVRMKERGRPVLYPLSKDGLKYLRPSKRWYFDLRDDSGTVRRIKGFADLKATEQLAAEMQRKASRVRSGLIDPAEEHVRRPLADHLLDYAAALEAKGNTAEHVKKTISLVSALFAGAGFVYPQDVDVAKAAGWLNALRRDGRPIELPTGVESFMPSEVAKLLGISVRGLSKNLKRRGLTGTGKGKARRIPRAAVETLALDAVRGVGPQQCNHYVRAAKGFTRWMARTRRIGANPLETLTLQSTATDVRHGRRELSADELRRLFTATQESERLFRGLTGEDRFMLYLVAAGTGFRANALANLTPADFALESHSPTVTTAARFAKNRRTKVQPLAADVATVLREFLAGKSVASPVWGGTWRSKAAEMLRADLEAAGIPYAVDGPDGQEHADFHALRHSYLTMLGRSGVDLRTAQELAGHSTPLLTSRYMHVRLRDAAGAVEKMPSLIPMENRAIPLRMTGTEGAKSAVPGAVTRGIVPYRSAPMCTFGVVGGESGDSSQTPGNEAAGADLHRPASIGTEWAVPGLNRGPSDFQSPASVSEAVDLKVLPATGAIGCSAGCSDKQSEAGTADADLAALVTAWPSLPGHIRAAIQALVHTAKTL